MSASNEWWEYHLTPRGWIDGTEKTDFALTEKAPPEDRVATYKFSEFLSSIYSKPDFGWDCLYSGGSKEAALKAQFGAYPSEHIKKRVSS
jgi:hypothetical protein